MRGMLRRTLASSVSVFTLVAVVAAVAVPASAAGAAPVVRTVSKAFRVAVPQPPSNTIGFFAYDQRTSTPCRANERALAPGIVNSTHYIAGHSFGPAAASAFLVGPAGTANAKLQLLCVRGGKISHKRIEARTVPGLGGTVSGETAGRATATANCPVGSVAIGAPLSQEYAPGLGSFTSKPHGPRGWQVVVNGVLDQLTAQRVVAAYADVACAKARAITKPRLALTMAGGTATGSLTCSGGRRALGWGVELGAFSTRFPSGGYWNIPLVKQASFNPAGTKMTFTFAVPAGSTATTVDGTAVAATVVCGKLVA